jgi:D-aminopeptidase
VTHKPLLALLIASFTLAWSVSGEPRPRARDIGLAPGVLPTGRINAITDVGGVLVGHATLIEGDDVRTGVTAVAPHGGNVFREKVPAAIVVGNGFGKLMGSTQVRELGEIETPILLTSTLNVPRVADALVSWMLALPDNGDVRSVNPVVAETNDGQLNDGRGRHVGEQHVFAALRSAKGGPVEEGCVGAGTGTIAFGFKGGIGTSSRVVPKSVGGYTVGVLVQSNFGGVLTIAGAPVGRELGRHYLKDELETEASDDARDRGDGSIIIVVATDAPLDARNLERLASRALSGLARTGAAMTNGSGDYVIAFSTAPGTRIRDGVPVRTPPVLANDAISPLFVAVAEATEEAIYNSLLKATTMKGREGLVVEALPVEKTLGILVRHGVVPARLTE